MNKHVKFVVCLIVEEKQTRVIGSSGNESTLLLRVIREAFTDKVIFVQRYEEQKE